jgi:signal transduction histidine kinase
MNDSELPHHQATSLSYEQQLDELCDAHGIVLAIADSNGACSFLNTGVSTLLGFSADFAIGKNLVDLSPQHEQFWRSVYDGVSTSIKQSKRYYREITLSINDTKVRFMCGFVPKVGEIEAEHKVYIVLIPLSESLSASGGLPTNERDNLIAVISHELRNPLATIRSGLTILELAPNSPQAATAHAMMKRQLLHAVCLVNDLLDVSRIKEGRLELKKTPTNVGDIVTLALEASSDSIKRGGHSLQVSLPEAAPTINGDLTRLAQVLTNLLDNASKYTPHGGTVKLHSFAAAQCIVFEVTDSGVGIPAHKLTEIFDPYAQIEESRSLSRGGLGIGLYLVKTIVEAHGGRIEVESDGATKGSTFRVTLPVAG